MSSPSNREPKSETHQIAISNENTNANTNDEEPSSSQLITEDNSSSNSQSQSQIMSPTPTIHVLHDVHDHDDDDVQMISEYDRKSGLIRQTQAYHARSPSNLNSNSNSIAIMSPTATMSSTSPAGASVPSVLLKRQYSNNSSSSACSGSEEFLQHQIQYQRSLSLSHSQELLSSVPHPILTATRRASAFTPYTNLQHRGSVSTSGFSGHGSSSVSSPLSTSSQHSITPPTVQTPTPANVKSPYPASAAPMVASTSISGGSNNNYNEPMCSLKWDDYESEVVDSLTALYKSEEWADVTLSCEGHIIKAHKVILAMCSPFFRIMFQESPCKHPHVIVNGMKRREFERVIHFIYNGQVSINPDELDDFLDAAESLKIDGVNGGGWAAYSPAGMAAMAGCPGMGDKSPLEHEHEDYSSAQGSMYTHHLHRHHSSRSTSDEYEHSLPVPFERLHLEENDLEHHPHVRRDSFERDERAATVEAEDSASTRKQDNEQIAMDEADNDRQQYPLNRLPKFQFKHRRHGVISSSSSVASGAATGDEGKGSSSSLGVRERRSTSSSISSGDTVVSSKTMLDQKMDIRRPGSGSVADARFEQISPPDTPDPNVEDADADDAPSTSKSIRLEYPIKGAQADDPASPVDMSVGSRSSILGPRPPPPPWYSPPSHKSHHDASRRSCHSSDDDSAIEEPEPGTSSGGTSGLHSPRSPSYAAAYVTTVITNTSRAPHHSQRHSLSHIYGDVGRQAGPFTFSGDESFMRRSLSLSPPENQSYQLHLPERRVVNEPYSQSIDVMNSSSSRKNLVSASTGTHLGDRRWMILPPTIGKRTFEAPTTGVQRFSQAQGSFNVAYPPSFPFQGFGTSPYPNPQAIVTTSSSSLSPKSPLYASRPDADPERPLNMQSYSAFMEGGAFGLNNIHKYRFKTTSSGFGNVSQLRMQLAGIGQSGADSLGNSPRASSSSSSASLGGSGSGQQSHSQGQSGSSGHNHSLLQQSMTSPHRSGMNHSLSSLTKPRTKAIRSCQVPQEFRYTAQEVDSMVERVENYPGPLVPCAVCAKFVKRERLRAHIHECHLLQGEKIICQYCGIALKSKGSYRVHIWRHKRGNLPTKKFKPGARRPSGSQ